MGKLPFAVAGQPVTISLRITNTHLIDVHLTITDVLPAEVHPQGTLQWPSVILAPGSTWTEVVVITPTVGFAGIVTNTLLVISRKDGVVHRCTPFPWRFSLVD